MGRPDDRKVMSCDRWELAISARVDGEAPEVEPRLLDAHLATCAACRRFEAVAAQTRREVRLRPAPELPDLSRRIVRLTAIADRAGRWPAVRVLLFAVAAIVVWYSMSELILGHENAASAHAARHLGAFSVAYGVGLLVVVVRPARARTLLPVAAVLAGALAITSVVDILDHRVPLAGEAIHLPELASVLLVWLVAVPVHPRTGRHRRSGDVRPGPRLAVVDDASPADGPRDRRADPPAAPRTQGRSSG